MCGVCTYAGCAELARIQDLHTCRVCMCAEFAHLQGVRCCACKQGVHVCACVCVGGSPPVRSGHGDTGTRSGAWQGLGLILHPWASFYSSHSMRSWMRPTGLQLPIASLPKPRSHARGHIPISMQVPGTLLGVMLPLGTGRGHTCHQQHPDVQAEPEASSALSSAAALPEKGRNRCCRLM